MDESNAAFSSALPDGEAGEARCNKKQQPATCPAVEGSSSALPRGADSADTTTTTAVTASAAERLKLSVSALITGRDTTVADHFTVLAGDEARAETLEPRPKGLAEGHLVSKNRNSNDGVTVLDDVAGGTAGWGTEGLLGTKPRTKRMLGAQLGLGLPQSVWAKTGESASTQQQCPYVAMGGAVTDSPAPGTANVRALRPFF